ncbi:MAG: hypothetical protein O4805_11335 [Trichodesmium sp. St16_bin2-tuft]|nr:hypothetical protein [Trichodesmium sp. MAG_R02]MDE5087699.1 hypothetical protein [Trichodesmium sp. St16_bin2-tuft]
MARRRRNTPRPWGENSAFVAMVNPEKGGELVTKAKQIKQKYGGRRRLSATMLDEDTTQSTPIK